MAATANLPAKNKAQDIRGLLEKSRKQMEMALPKHLSADRLLRVAMTSIQRTPKLLECTPQSLLACVMTCAQLGLEPDQFLGQAYLVPFEDRKKGVTICTLIPGYRGYIALARRSGEVQTVSSQVVYDGDAFTLEYGIQDTLRHIPALNGDRGKPVGAYVVFKYKDGSYSFDFMSVGDIERIRERSKASGSGPWVTDWDEMAKKTVIKRHAKLAPLSVEFQKAIALEDRANAGESQMDIMSDDPDVIDAEAEAAAIEQGPSFDAQVPPGVDRRTLNAYLTVCSKHFQKTVDEVKASAAGNMTEFLHQFNKWAAARAKANEAKAAEKPAPEAKSEAEASNGFVCPWMNSDEPAEKKFCDSKCDPDARKDCPKYDTAK